MSSRPSSSGIAARTGDAKGEREHEEKSRLHGILAAAKASAPTEEKRGPTHCADAAEPKHASASSSSSTAKESKLKQPEIVTARSRTTATTTTTTTVPETTASTTSSHLRPPSGAARASKATADVHHLKRVPPLPPDKRGSQVAYAPAPARADAKTAATTTSTTSSGQLHQVRSVQSLATELRRIRSQRSDQDLAHEAKNAAQSKLGAKDEGAPAAKPKSDMEQQEKPVTQRRPSLRTKIMLELAEPSTIDEQHEMDAMDPDRHHDRDRDHAARCATPTDAAVSPPLSSTSKKGINRHQFTEGLGAAFCLDLQPPDPRAIDKPFDLSASGTFDAVDFQIKPTGLTRSPDQVESPTKAGVNAKKHLIKLGILGRGASGVVHKALHVPSLLLVAVKVIPVFDNEKRHQLINELKALYNNLSTLSDDDDASARKTVACPEIVCLYDAFMNPNEGNVSIVVEYMDGGSLQDIVETGGCKSESVLANISFRVLTGLAYLHNMHQLHRDIKPGNLLINHLGDVKISDFGIVREMENSMAKATTFVGTLTYMSPERIASEEYSYKSDVWSLGLSIMTCALGRFPYASKGGYWELLHMIRNEPPPRLPEGEFSTAFCDFLDKCLKKDQNERWGVKQLLTHDFIKQCERASKTARGEDPDSGCKAGEKSTEDSKEAAEIDEIVQKVTEYYLNDARDLVREQHQSLSEIASWLQALPAMQKVKLTRLANQIGIPPSIVYNKFNTAMNDLLHEIQDTFFDDSEDDKQH